MDMSGFLNINRAWLGFVLNAPVLTGIDPGKTVKAKKEIIHKNLRVAQFGRVLALEASCRRFKSCLSDQ